VSTPAGEVPRSKHRGRRALIALLVVVVLLIGAFFAGDYFVKAYATNYVREQVAASLGLRTTAPVTVDLGAGSILLQAAAGRINDVRVSVNPISFDGLSGSATLTAHGVPLDQTTPVKSLGVKVYLPTSTVTAAIARVPALKALNPTVKFSGEHVAVAGTVYVLGFPQSIGATLVPTVTDGEPGFRIVTASFDHATVSADLLDRYLPGLTGRLESGTSLCIASHLPKAFTLTGIAVKGQSIVSTFTGNGVVLNSAALSHKGTCPAN